MTGDAGHAHVPLEHLAPPARAFSLTLVEVRSFVFLARQVRSTASGNSFEELFPFYRRILRHNLLFGWWSFPFGLIWTPLAIRGNRRALRHLRALASSGAAPAGWHPDPTGRHQSRWWDGERWTDKVSDPNIQSDPED